MRILKWISWGLGGLVVLLLLTIAVIVWVVDPNAFKPRIEAEVRSATGRDFTLTGDIEIGFFPWLALHTGPGSFGNPKGFPPEPMAQWQSAQLGARLFPLLRGELVVDRVRLEGADVRLVRHADGTANWQGIGSNAPVDPNRKSRHITVDGVEITGSHLLFIDEGAQRRIEVADLNLTTDEIDPAAPFTDTDIAGRLHVAGFDPAGVPFRLRVPKAALTQDYSKLDMPEFSLAFGGLEATGGINGEFGDVVRMGGAVESNSFDLKALLASVGIAAPKTTDPAALTRIQLQATWKLDAGAMAVDPLQLTVDDTHFKGRFQRAAGERPVGDFALHGDVLNLSRYIPPTDPNSEPFVLPTALLKSLGFRGVLELEQATLDDIAMKGVTLRLLLDEQGLHQEKS